MGCGFSSPSSTAALPPCAGVRVIHTNGYVQDFHGPGVVTVAHVTGGLKPSSSSSSDGPASPPRYVLCSSAHLLQPGRGPFRPDDPLQPGTVYFLLPHSAFQAEASAVDLACLMNRLTALARRGAAAAAPAPGPVEALFAAAAAAHHRAPDDRSRQQTMAAAPPTTKAARSKEPAAQPGRPAPWRPRLDRIDESIGRASMRSSASTRSACSEA